MNLRTLVGVTALTIFSIGCAEIANPPPEPISISSTIPVNLLPEEKECADLHGFDIEEMRSHKTSSDQSYWQEIMSQCRQLWQINTAEVANATQPPEEVSEDVIPTRTPTATVEAPLIKCGVGWCGEARELHGRIYYDLITNFRGSACNLGNNQFSSDCVGVRTTEVWLFYWDNLHGECREHFWSMSKMLNVNTSMARRWDTAGWWDDLEWHVNEYYDTLTAYKPSCKIQ